MSNRIAYIKEHLQKENTDVLMVQTRANVLYLSGFDTDPHERLVAVIVFKGHDPLLICPNMEVNQVKEVFHQGDVIGYSDSENPWQKLNDYFTTNQLSLKKVALEKSLSWERLQAWQTINQDIAFTEADPILNELRIIKDEAEIDILREAAQLADKGIQAGISALKEGVTEMEVLATIEYSLKKIGIREMSFSTMVLFGEKAGDPHGNPGSRKLKKGDGVLFDLGVVWKGYCSDITRTVFFDHVKDKDAEIYETVLEAQKKSLASCQPGEPISSLDVIARKHITDAGFGSYFPHRIGHGLGIEVHEFPSLNDQNATLLKKGMTFTIEPGIYVPNQTGVRIEDDVLITETGYETLTQFTKELTVVPCK
ncbi:peptidase M24 family protein [Salipaludibacillus keqinensis]|jgi:Xaa-Pro dipeptidase|uniref:Peptidase M24 family protein n=1 Tax=Salipaludibacillus keqinensis TaxID=2045207 RepID=A0A323TEJ8_9BACI|nr:Xaa-Pro peptidase family protein [Salipaludibacillus keqinensis]PYZ93752.1 peptidase M24 family protein [Salipaludibacillus keqinensis]